MHPLDCSSPEEKRTTLEDALGRESLQNGNQERAECMAGAAVITGEAALWVTSCLGLPVLVPPYLL